MMPPRRIKKAGYLLILANLMPVYGVWFLSWDPFKIFLVYCLETVIIGMITLVKIGVASYNYHQPGKIISVSGKTFSGIGLMLFFLVHYGMFVGIQTPIFLKFSYKPEDLSILSILMDPYRYLGSDGMIMLASFTLAYGLENLTAFIMNNEYRDKPIMRIMMEPYFRIFIQQFTVIIGGFFLMFGAGKLFILIFAVVKIWITLFIDYSRVLKLAMARAQESNSSHS